MGAAVVAGVSIVALVAGAILGWFLASRAIAPLKQERDNLASASEEWRSKFSEAIVNLAAEAEKSKRLGEVEAQLATEREAAAALRSQVAAFQADAQNFDTRLKDLTESKDALIAQFREVGDQLLDKAHKDFLEKAGERFSKADQQSEAKLKALLQPVETTLKRYEEGLQRVEKERVDHYAGLKAVVDQVREGQGQVRDEARRLVTALTSSPKQRGRWGEQSLRNVLTQAGLVEGVDFEMEVSVNTDEGRLRPDAVVNLPQGRNLIIDAKCSLNAYVDACDEVDDDRRATCLKAHLASIVRHAQQLASKSYWAQFGEAADYVIMYIPGEHFLTAALEQDSDLWEKAFKDRVLLATPTNLVAIARTVASVWRQEKLAAEAGKIAELGRELHSRLATMAEHVASVGTNLSRANNAYNKMVGSLESQVFTQARRFEELGAGSAKDIPPPPMVEASPRPLTKLAAKEEEPIVVSLDDPTLPRLEKAEEDDEE